MIRKLIARLNQYNLEMVHHHRTQHGSADGLSKRTIDDVQQGKQLKKSITD